MEKYRLRHIKTNLFYCSVKKRQLKIQETNLNSVGKTYDVRSKITLPLKIYINQAQLRKFLVEYDNPLNLIVDSSKVNLQWNSESSHYILECFERDWKIEEI